MIQSLRTLLFHVKLSPRPAFVMRRPPRFAALLLVLLAVLGVAALACGRIAKPAGWASPALANNLLLVAHKDKLYALDPNTLAEKWRFPGSEDKASKTTALYGSLGSSNTSLFVPGYSGKLYTVASDTGKAGEQPFGTGGPLVGGVTAVNGTVYFGSSDGKLYALDAATGAERWQPFETGNEIWSTPAVAGGTVYVTSLDGSLYAIDAATGAERWSYQTAAGVASPPVVDQSAGLVYVGGFDSRLRAIDIESHEQRWEIAAGNWFWTRPLAVGGVVYAGSLDSKVYAVDASTGKSPWAKPFSAKAPVRGAPVLANGKLIIVDQGGHVYALNTSDGTLAAGPLSVGGDVAVDPLVLPDGKVLVVTTGGAVVRIDPATLTIVNQRQL
jgi:outer membrane protein assembly factor BamB